MSRKLFLALGAAALTIGATAFAAAPAAADHGHYRACVTAGYGAWLFPVWCHHGRGYRCAQPVRRGRAFRVVGQTGGYLLVRNLQARGWIELNSVRFAPQAYCRAAGI